MRGTRARGSPPLCHLSQSIFPACPFLWIGVFGPMFPLPQHSAAASPWPSCVARIFAHRCMRLTSSRCCTPGGAWFALCCRCVPRFWEHATNTPVYCLGTISRAALVGVGHNCWSSGCLVTTSPLLSAGRPLTRSFARSSSLCVSGALYSVAHFVITAAALFRRFGADYSVVWLLAIAEVEVRFRIVTHNCVH